MTTPAEILATFARLTVEAFEFLSTYGFSEIERRILGPDAWIVFRNKTTDVTVTFEFGTGVWTSVGRLRDLDGKLVETEGYDILYLLQLRAPAEARQTLIEDFEVDKVAVELRKQSDSLKKYGADVLKGDFSIFDKIKPLAEENLRKREEKLFGRSAEQGFAGPPHAK